MKKFSIYAESIMVVPAGGFVTNHYRYIQNKCQHCAIEASALKIFLHFSNSSEYPVILASCPIVRSGQSVILFQLLIPQENTDTDSSNISVPS